MAIFAISFRIQYDETYDERYASVVEAIKALSPAIWWDETSSFILIESSRNSAGVAAYIDANSKVDASKDLVLVINLSAKAYATIGNVADADLAKLMAKR